MARDPACDRCISAKARSTTTSAPDGRKGAAISCESREADCRIWRSDRSVGPRLRWGRARRWRCSVAMAQARQRFSIRWLASRAGAAGTITLGRETSALRPDQRQRRHRLGATGTQYLRSLTVEENLTAIARPGRFDIDSIYEMFPVLRERSTNMGNQLSGGEQQMLAVGRALVLNPQILLLTNRWKAWRRSSSMNCSRRLRKIIEAEKMSVILVEQSARKILPR